MEPAEPSKSWKEILRNIRSTMMMESVCGNCHTGVARQFVGVGGVAEWHVAAHCESIGTDLVAKLEAEWLAALREADIPPDSTIFRRVFCSDVVNQQPGLEPFARRYPGAFSIIGQPPATSAKMAIWSYHIVDPQIARQREGGGESFVLHRGSLTHAWNSGLCDPVGCDATTQSATVMEKLDHELAANGMTLKDHTIRTWWFLRDIDADYQALVDVRKAAFSACGLTEDTHYIASTGIAGAHQDPAVKLSLDAYAVSGLVPGQVEYLSAEEHLGPTHRYGVTFERATAVSYSDRKHVFISGTASIDPSGAIMHPGDVVRQLDRAIDNVAALLASTGASLHDLAMAIIYLRDPADGAIVARQLRTCFRDLPLVIVYAPVCRPGWLVEIEGIATVLNYEPKFPEF